MSTVNFSFLFFLFVARSLFLQPLAFRSFGLHVFQGLYIVYPATSSTPTSIHTHTPTHIKDEMLVAAILDMAELNVSKLLRALQVCCSDRHTKKQNGMALKLLSSKMQ